MTSPSTIIESARSRLIVALDLPDRRSALAAVDRLAGRVGCFKLGLEIFAAEGPALVREICARGERVFLDLKLHDIPNTVAGAVRSVGRLKVQMLTVHASGGRAMLEAARNAIGESASPPLLVAVTALTSLASDDIGRFGIREPIEDWVERLADIARAAKIPALVCSPLELARMRRRFGREMFLISPGIRPAGSASQDQSRTATPEQAIRAGADYIVVGRPILQASDPAGAAEQIVQEIENALGSTGSAPNKNEIDSCP